jgi:diketogulonate reductase-like aldo/keto reductase
MIHTTLNTQEQMPLLGLGVYDVNGQEAVTAIRTAIDLGYRLIDTAAMYHNEKEVGEAIRQSGVAREEIFLTTKVNNNEQGFEQTLRAFEASQQRLDCEYIDLYLVHWPLRETRKDTWLALEKLYQDGKVKAIGVANYLLPFLEELLPSAKVVPALNQVEFSPYLFLSDLLDYCRQHGIVLQAYTPLLRGARFDDPKLLALAEKYSKTPAQIILRWAVQLGVSTIPKSANPKRLQENIDIFDFEISAEDMAKMATFNENFRVVDDPIGLF